MATRIVLVMSPEGYARGLISGFSAFALTKGWAVSLVAPTIHMDRPVSDMLQRIRSERPNALVVTRSWWQYLGPQLRQEKIIIGAEADLTEEGRPSVVVDNAEAGREAARYLLRKGFRSFAAYGLRTERFAVERAEAFRTTVEAEGRRFTGWGNDQSTLAKSSHQWIAEFRQWIDSVPKPAGVLACCDHWGNQMLEACTEAGVRVPQHVAVLGVDNDEIMSVLSRPAMSSVVVPWARLGQEVARLVDRALLGDPAPGEPVRIAPGSVVERASTDVDAMQDREVGLALTFIRKNAGRAIGVPDLLEQIPVSRRRLEQRFRKVTGRTLLDAIRQAHIDQAKRLLETTAMTTAEIAEESGFRGASRFAFVFRRHTGVTPTEYRRKFQLQYRAGDVTPA